MDEVENRLLINAVYSALAKSDDIKAVAKSLSCSVEDLINYLIKNEMEIAKDYMELKKGIEESYEWKTTVDGATRIIKDKPSARSKDIENMKVVKKRKGELTKED
jgi:hypothetical protein